MKIKTFSVQMMQFPAILFFIFGVDINGAGLGPAKRPPAGGHVVLSSFFMILYYFRKIKTTRKKVFVEWVVGDKYNRG